MSRQAQQRTIYDHRIRNAVVASGDPRLFSAFDINPFTTRSWLRRGYREVVTADIVDKPEVELLQIIAEQNRTILLLRGLLCMLSALVRVFGARLDKNERLPEGRDKKTILRSIDKAVKAGIPLGRALHVIGLSPPRYNAWKRAAPACELDDRSSCPKTSPNQLAPKEIATMKAIFTDERYRHMPIASLARWAQRARLLAASVGTWYRIIKQRQWINPRVRIYPPKPSIGVRALAPNVYWHIDTTVIRLLDGTRLYLHAVIDNYSRKILAWALRTKLDPLTTCEILSQASAFLGAGAAAKLVADKGNENTAADVNAFLRYHDNIKRVLAQVEVSYSDSMIEAFWLSFKHRWLFLNKLDTYNAVLKLVSFYIDQHNLIIPHSAFEGQTPDEMYYGLGNHITEELAAYRLEARQERLRYNRSVSCQECLEATPPVDDSSSALASEHHSSIPLKFPS
jgi:putative transposase